MSRRWVFYRLRQLTGEGYAVQTIRNRQCNVQVHTLMRVCKYRADISPFTCTKPAPRSVTNRNHRTSQFATHRGESS
jgi:hypothetical protein